MTSELHLIERQLHDIGAAIRYEGAVCRAELEERQRLQLHGAEAVGHYNDWMRRYGLTHLVVK